MTSAYYPYEGGKIKVSCWVKYENIKSDDLNTWNKGALIVDFYTADKRNIIHKEWKYHDGPGGFEGTCDWRYVEKVINVPRRDTGVAFLRVWATLFCCTGTLWVDDLKIERIPEAGKDDTPPERWIGMISEKKTLLTERVKELESRIEEVKGKGGDTLSALAVLTTCKVFLKYVDDDIAAGKAGQLGKNEIGDLMAKGVKTLNYEPGNEAFFRVFYQYIPGGPFALAYGEMVKCLDLCEAAVKELGGQDGARVAAPLDDTQEGLVIKDGSFVNKSGAPVFLIGFCFFDEGRVDKGWREGLGANCNGSYWGGSIKKQFYEDEVETPLSMQTNRMVETLKKHPGVAADFLFMLWNQNCIPQWMLKLDPSIEAKGNHFNGSDPDHPFIRTYDTLIHASVARALAPYNGTTVPMIMYNLHNEPRFNSFTSHTKAKFIPWLRKAYGGDLAKLNRLYKKSYADFSEVEKSTTGTPAQRYDWFRFNHERITDMFMNIRAATKENDPKAVVHIKLMSNYWDV